MGGVVIDMPTGRRATSTSHQADAPATLAWFDDALPRIFGYFLPRVGGEIPQAEDLTQETMLAAVRAHGNGAKIDAVLPWLFGIARHKLIDHYRAADAHRQHLDASETDLDTVAESTRRLPALDLNSIHARDAIIATLLHLPPRQQLAVVLRYFDDLPVTEVAAALDLTVSATESLLARSRRSFRIHYLASNGDES